MEKKLGEVGWDNLTFVCWKTFNFLLLAVYWHFWAVCLLLLVDYLFFSAVCLFNLLFIYVFQLFVYILYHKDKNSPFENLSLYKIHTSGISFFQNSNFWNLNFHKIHISKISILTKFAFMKSQLSQNSHLWNLNFHEIHNSEISIFTKFTFLKSHSYKIHICEISIS